MPSKIILQRELGWGAWLHLLHRRISASTKAQNVRVSVQANSAYRKRDLTLVFTLKCMDTNQRLHSINSMHKTCAFEKSIKHKHESMCSWYTELWIILQRIRFFIVYTKRDFETFLGLESRSFQLIKPVFWIKFQSHWGQRKSIIELGIHLSNSKY